MKFELKPYHRNIPRKTLLTDLQLTARRLGQETVTVAQYNQEGSYNALTLIRRFKSWNNALRKAGLQISNHYNIPTPLLFANLQKLWSKLGRQPTLRDMYPPQSRYSLATYAHRFGTWRGALQQFITAMNTKEHPRGAHVSLSSGEMRATSLSSGGGLSRSFSGSRGEAVHKTSRTINWRLRFRVMQRDNFRCVACGRTPATDAGIILHLDHIHPWQKGGETILENLQTLCSVCNIGKSNL